MTTFKGLPGWVLSEAGVRRRGDGCWEIPYHHADGRLFNVRVVAPSGRRWWKWRFRGAPMIPYGLAELAEERDRGTRGLLVGEGESDGLWLRVYAAGASHPELDGFDALALPGAKTWTPAWRRWLEHYPAIYLFGDGDAAGRALNAAIARDIPWAMPVWLPDDTDVRSLIGDGRVDALDPYIRDAEQEARLRAAWTLSRTIDEYEGFVRDHGIAA